MQALIAWMLAATAPDASLVAFADAFDRAQLAQDRAAMERMIADDLVFVDGSGKRQGKKEFIEGWMTPGDRYDPLVLVDRVIMSLGPDAGVVNAETNLTGVSGGKWQVAHIQVTRMAPVQP